MSQLPSNIDKSNNNQTAIALSHPAALTPQSSFGNHAQQQQNPNTNKKGKKQKEAKSISTSGESSSMHSYYSKKRGAQTGKDTPPPHHLKNCSRRLCRKRMAGQ